LKTTSRIVRIASALGLLLALALLAACAAAPAEPATAPDSEPAASSAPVTPPTIKLVEPVADGTVKAGVVTVSVETTGLKFVMPSNTNVAGEGHVHFTLDDRPFVMSTEPGTDLKDVSAGPHKLTAELVQNDTKPFSPPVEVEIEFVAE